MFLAYLGWPQTPGWPTSAPWNKNAEKDILWSKMELCPTSLTLWDRLPPPWPLKILCGTRGLGPLIPNFFVLWTSSEASSNQPYDRENEGDGFYNRYGWLIDSWEYSKVWSGLTDVLQKVDFCGEADVKITPVLCKLNRDCFRKLFLDISFARFLPLTVYRKWISSLMRRSFENSIICGFFQSFRYLTPGKNIAELVV